MGYSPWGYEESDVTDHTHTHTHKESLNLSLLSVP